MSERKVSCGAVKFIGKKTGLAVGVELEFVVVICPDCNAVFGLPAEMHTRFEQMHKVFCCPYGHAIQYPQRA